jgi:hypothetical protein
MDIPAGCWSRFLRLPRVGEVAVETPTTVGDADLGAER